MSPSGNEGIHESTASIALASSSEAKADTSKLRDLRAMKTKRDSKPKLTDAERHKRFVETAEKVEASTHEADFDDAFTRVARPPAANDGRPKRA